MTYGIIALVLLLVGALWWVLTGRGDRQIQEMEAAIASGDEDRLSALLKNSPKVAQNLSDVTFLLLKSIMANRPVMVRELLDIGHPPAELQLCAGEHGVDLLSVAIESADADVLRMLMAAGMKETSEAMPPVLTCYVAGRPEHLKVLQIFEATEQSPEQLRRGFTPLHVAAFRFSENPEQILAMLQPLLEGGANVNAQTAGGNTPLDMAMDRTHEGGGDNEELVKLLRSYGAQRGRSLRVPHPHYTGRLYFETVQPQPLVAELPEGVVVEMHAGVCAAVAEADFPEVWAASAAKKAALNAHRSYADLRVNGQPGEDPLAVAGRGLAVLTALAKTEGVVGVQFEKTLLIPSEYELSEEEGVYCPLLYADFRFGRTEDKMVLVDTAGLSRFGLREVELVVTDRVLRKHKSDILAGLVSDFSATVVAGASAWEAGHTASLRGLFCRIGYGKHAITENEGFVFVVDQS